MAPRPAPARPERRGGPGRGSDGAATSTGTPRRAGRAMTAPSVPRPAPPAVTTGTRPDVQGLRAVAVLLVVLAHVGVPWLPGGFVGVDVFFVISGFLITGLLLREREATGRIRLRAVFARRAPLILPAATVVLLATVGYAAATLPASRVGEVVTDSRWSAVFLANVHFARVGGDY